MGSTTDGRRIRSYRWMLAGGILLAACLTWAYWPSLSYMVRGKWWPDAQYQYCFLVPVFSGILLWLRRERVRGIELRGSWWGIPVLAASLALYLFGAVLYIPWCEGISIVPCLIGICLVAGGWGLLGWSWPAIAFLAFMIPLPYRVEVAFSDRLQEWSANASTYCLQTVGFPAFSEGTDIIINESRISVVKACSGLSMLMTFFALSTAVAFLLKRPLWEKLVVVASAAPIALASNITRVASTAGIYQATNDDGLRNLVHEHAGWMMMLVGLAFLGVELLFMAFVVVVPAPHDSKRPMAKPVLPKTSPPSRIPQVKPTPIRSALKAATRNR